MFRPESSRLLSLPSTVTAINTFKHSASNLRLVCVAVPGPLVSASIVVPTAAHSHKGLAHTLEHLVFMGTPSFPRGYLDGLAVRCLSSGTNAYTTEDHTAYTITTVGAQGMKNLLPVFLDHVLHPLLEQDQFRTEVFSIDGAAKCQGVVYCEMASRENTEADKLDLCIRQSLYPQNSTYAFECGGLTKHIAQLSNDEIKQFHQKFYNGNICIFLCGQIEPTDFFAALDSIKIPTSSPMPEPLPSSELLKASSKTIHFPSDDTSVASIAFAWQGPQSKDIFTITALDVLFRFFSDTSASPLFQRFVEIEDPLASDVEFDLRGYVQGSISLIFSGVPYLEDADEDASELEIETDPEDEDIVCVAERHSELPEHLEPGFFRKELVSTLKNAVESLSLEKMHRTIKRHRQKILEALEDDPHEYIASALIPDLLHFYFSGEKAEKPSIGTRAELFEILDSLLQKDISFWQKLASEWVLEAPFVEITCLPDPKLAQQLRDDEAADIEARKKQYGEKGLKKLQKELDAAIERNKINIPRQVLESMPPIPDGSKASKIRVVQDNKEINLLPFAVCQSIKTDTAFSHVRIALNTEAAPAHLRPYLVLLQELLFQTDVKTKHGIEAYTDIVQYTSEISVSHEVSVGFGNDIWSTSWLSEMFLASLSCLPEQFENGMKHLSKVLFHSVFPKERVLSVAKNLLSMIAETKRSGSDMLVALVARLTCPMDSNDIHISLFKQEEFLKNVVARIGNGEHEEIEKSLLQLRDVLLSCTPELGGFVQLSINEKDFKDKNVLTLFSKVWRKEYEAYTNGKRRLESMSLVSPFPFPRKPFALSSVDQKFGTAVMVPISGLQTSYLNQIIECDVLKDKNDFLPVLVLCELLSRTEGPLYTAIRGKGYAYGTSLDLYQWTGQLVFDVQDSSEPQKALECFYNILHDLGDQSKFEKTCDQFNIETAKAGVSYRFYAQKATAGSVIFASLRASLRGSEVNDNETLFQQRLSAVKPQDIKRVYERYLMRFLDPQKRFTVMTTTTGEASDKLIADFKNAKGSMSLAFSKQELKDMNL